MQDPPDLTDRIRRAQRGDRLAVGELWLEQRRFVATVLLAHTGSRDLDDLLQEVALRMTRGLGELGDPVNLRPWLRAIARNVAIDHGRRRAAPTPLQIVVARDDDRAAGPPRPEPWVDGQQQQRQRDELEQTLRDLATLDPLYREPLLLRAVDGLSQREIAAALGVPETTIETRLARARRLLRELREDTDTHAGADAGTRRNAPIRRTVD